uniref:Hypotheticial protein n=1 Tax=Schistosoma japonicum TaxID=6182 RepID=C1LFN1_SCHJA|nr:hypotheticial protein [Schistosoma japonicum]
MTSDSNKENELYKYIKEHTPGIIEKVVQLSFVIIIHTGCQLWQTVFRFKR